MENQLKYLARHQKKFGKIMETLGTHDREIPDGHPTHHHGSTNIAPGSPLRPTVAPHDLSPPHIVGSPIANEYPQEYQHKHNEECQEEQACMSGCVPSDCNSEYCGVVGIILIISLIAFVSVFFLMKHFVRHNQTFTPTENDETDDWNGGATKPLPPGYRDIVHFTPTLASLQLICNCNLEKIPGITFRVEELPWTLCNIFVYDSYLYSNSSHIAVAPVSAANTWFDFNHIVNFVYGKKVFQKRPKLLLGYLGANQKVQTTIDKQAVANAMPKFLHSTFKLPLAGVMVFQINNTDTVSLEIYNDLIGQLNPKQLVMFGLRTDNQLSSDQMKSVMQHSSLKQPVVFMSHPVLQENLKRLTCLATFGKVSEDWSGYPYAAMQTSFQTVGGNKNQFFGFPGVSIAGLTVNGTTNTEFGSKPSSTVRGSKTFTRQICQYELVEKNDKMSYDETTGCSYIKQNSSLLTGLSMSKLVKGFDEWECVCGLYVTDLVYDYTTNCSIVSYPTLQNIQKSMYNLDQQRQSNNSPCQVFIKV